MGAFEPRTVTLPGGEEVALRAATPEDATPLLLYLRVEMGTTDQVLTQPDELPRTFEEERGKIAEIHERGGLFMLAMSAGAFVGVLSLHPGQRRRNRHTAEFGITVAQAWRGRGVGTAMMRAMMEWARAHEYIEKVCLQVFSTNPRARAMYESFGFIEEGRQAGHGQLRPGVYADNILMGVWVKERRDGAR